MRIIVFLILGISVAGVCFAQLAQHPSLQDQQKLENQDQAQDKKDGQQKQQQQTADFQSLEQQQQGELSGGPLLDSNFLGGGYSDGQSVSHYSQRGSASRASAHSGGGRRRKR